MPVAGKIYTKRIDLAGYPEDDPAWVEVMTNPKADIREGMPVVDGNNQLETVKYFFSKVITDWNFTEEDGVTKSAITPENVSKALSMLDMEAITKELGFMTLPDAKKNS